eukprot:1163544-Pleurochrysis_carterae.AAC.1
MEAPTRDGSSVHTGQDARAEASDAPVKSDNGCRKSYWHCNRQAGVEGNWTGQHCGTDQRSHGGEAAAIVRASHRL